MMDTTLTVFEFIREYLATHPWAPSFSEIAAGCNFAWPSSVVRHLDYLQAWGLIERVPGQARSITVTEKGRRFQL